MAKANYIVFPDAAEKGSPEFFSSTLAAKRYAGPLANKLGKGVFVYRENLSTGIMQRVDTVHPYLRSRSHYGRKKRNGSSYARKGVSIGVPRHGFTPKVGDKFYVSGKLVTIKRKDGDGMLWFNRDVDGTVAMSESNLYQAAYVPEDSPFAPYEYRIKKNPTPVRLKVGRKTYPGMAKKVNGRVKIFVTPGVARKINPSMKNGFTLEVAGKPARFFYGKGAAKERAIKAGVRAAKSGGTFALTDMVSARTEQFKVSGKEAYRL